MKCVKQDLIKQRRFIFDGDEPYSIDPITILLDENTKTCTITDGFGKTYSHTWRGFNTKDNDFIKFFETSDRDWGYFCGKLGLVPTHLNLSKSKKYALQCFFRHINKETSKEEIKSVIHKIETISTYDVESFERLAHIVIDDYSDAWDCTLAITSWEGTEKNMKEAIIALAPIIRKEYAEKENLNHES